MLPIAALWAIPWVRKLAIYAAIAAAVFYALRLWGNKQWQVGEQQGRVAAFREAEKGMIQQQIAVEKAINDMRQQLLLDRAVLLAQQEELAKTRAVVAGALTKILTEVKASKVVTDAKVDAVPASQLDSALRAKSNELTGQAPR